MPQRVLAMVGVRGWRHPGRSARPVDDAKKRRPWTFRANHLSAYRVHMGDGSARETWATYLRRMTDRPGWSVARLARESGIHRGTIFKWISGKGGVTVASVRSIAEALGDSPTNALRAAGSVVDKDAPDYEVELVRSDTELSDPMKVRIIEMIFERRERERAAALADTQRLIDLMKRTGGEPAHRR